MKPTSIILALLLAVPLLAETKTRYLVATRHSAAETGLRLVRDVDQVSSHDVRTFDTVDFFAADLTESEVSALRKSADVRYVSPVVERHIALASNVEGRRDLNPAATSRYSREQTIPYGIDLIGARSVWPVSKGSGMGTTNVVVVDTGIEYTHPDLGARYAGGYNVFTKKDDPMDDHGHGTHVSGTIAAVDNQFGVVGVAPDVRLWGVKVLNSNGMGTDETVMAGVDWVRKKKQELGGNWIISLSLGSTTSSPAEREMFAGAITEGIIIAAAAGNRSFESIDFPAAYQGVLAITAIDKDSAVAEFSSFGAGVAFAAPGVEVLSTYRVGRAEAVDIVTERGFSPTPAYALNDSGKGELTADFVDCGFGRPEEIPASVAGKIALISRSPRAENFRFSEKAINAVKAGAVAVVIRANDEQANMRDWTLTLNGEPQFDFPVVIGIDKEDGEKLRALAGKEKLSISYVLDDYKVLSGTSMATPHVSGTAALIWSLVPNATAEQVRLAMKLTADDLGAANYDKVFGYGRINPLAAAKYLAPGVFNVDPPPPLNPKRKRQGH